MLWLPCMQLLSPFSTLVFRRRWQKNSPAKKLITCSFVPSAKGQTEDENFQRMDQQNKFLQRRMNVKNYFYVKIFPRRRRNDGMENGYYMCTGCPKKAGLRFQIQISALIQITSVVEIHYSF